MYGKFFKRLFDLVFALLLFVLTFPVAVILAIAIKIDSKGPILFKQTRLGQHGKEFCILKFRSMCVGAEGKGSGVYSGKGDTRVTRVGKILRATSADELPQLINIIKGEMSFIGPRPPLTYHPWPIEQYTDEQKRMFDVRPGITGWAQINGRDELEIDVKARLDGEYTAELNAGNFRGFLMDLRCFFGTFVSVLRQDGVVEGGTGELEKQKEKEEITK